MYVFVCMYIDYDYYFLLSDITAMNKNEETNKNRTNKNCIES